MVDVDSVPFLSNLTSLSELSLLDAYPRPFTMPGLSVLILLIDNPPIIDDDLSCLVRLTHLEFTRDVGFVSLQPPQDHWSCLNYLQNLTQLTNRGSSMVYCMPSRREREIGFRWKRIEQTFTKISLFKVVIKDLRREP